MQKLWIWVGAAIAVGIVFFFASIALVLFLLLDSAEPSAEPVRGNVIAGAAIFDRAGCGRCHSLAVAGAQGDTGPDLDFHLRSHPHSFEFVVRRIRDGAPGMPGYRRRLTENEIRDVAAFVVGAAGSDD